MKTTKLLAYQLVNIRTIKQFITTVSLLGQEYLKQHNNQSCFSFFSSHNNHHLARQLVSNADEINYKLFNNEGNNQDDMQEIINFIHRVKMQTGRGSLNNLAKLAVKQLLQNNAVIRKAYESKYNPQYPRVEQVEGGHDIIDDPIIHHNLIRGGLM